MEVLLALGLALFIFIISGIFGYYIQHGLSVGGLIASSNFGFNFLLNTLVSPVIILIACFVLVNTDHQNLQLLWVASVFVIGFQAFVIAIFGQFRSIKFFAWLCSSILSVGLSLLIVSAVQYSRAVMRISPTSVAAILWTFGILSIIFLIYSVLPQNFQDRDSQDKFMLELYKKYSRAYNSLLSKNFKTNDQLKILFFAILITEDLNRPALFRSMERLLFHFGFISTTGIMQVTSRQKLTDAESVKRAQKLIEDYYTAAKAQEKSEYMLIKNVAFRYNDGDFYTDLVITAYYVLQASDLRSLS